MVNYCTLLRVKSGGETHYYETLEEALTKFQERSKAVDGYFERCIVCLGLMEVVFNEVKSIPGMRIQFVFHDRESMPLTNNESIADIIKFINFGKRQG